MLKYLCACSNSENHTTSNMCGNCLKDASLLTQMGVEDDEERTGGEALNECSDLNSVFYFIIIIRRIVLLQDTGYKALSYYNSMYSLHMECKLLTLTYILYFKNYFLVVEILFRI